MKIKTKLLTFIGGSLIVLLAITFYTLLFLTSNKITSKLNDQLNNQTDTITTQVADLIKSSARSYLMAAGEEADIISQKFYSLSEDGIITSDQAKQFTFETLSSFNFLSSGYIYTTDKDGTILSHPNKDVINTTSSIYSWMKGLKPSDKSFYSYEYQGRNKLLYRIYNKDLGINICVSAYISDLLSVMDMNELNIAMNNTKIGKSGYPLLITKKGIFITQPNTKLLNTNVLGLKDADGNTIIKRMIDEGNGSFNYNWKEDDGSIKKKFTYFKTEQNSELIVSLTGYVDDFYDTVTDIKNIILISGLLVIIILFIIIFFISSSLTKPIIIFTSSLKEISEGNGDLTKRIELKSKDETGTMVEYFNNFLETLQNIIIEIKNSAENTIKIKNEISFGVDETSASIHEITTNIQSINKQTQLLNTNVAVSADSIAKISNNILDLNSSIDTQSIMLQTSTAAITEMISSIDNVSKITTTKQASAKDLLFRAKEGSEDINNTLNAVNEVSNQLLSIKDMAIIISGIASQTNLLAMNAAIEAAHAGDAGKGFAVVADEIRKLAETSSSNSTQITNTLKNVEASIVLANQLSKNTSESFSLVNSEIIEIVGALEEIDNSTNELQIGGKEILQSITGLEEVSETVKEKSVDIRNESDSVSKSMNDTKYITMEVVTAIDEIGQGTNGISESMSRVSTTSFKLKDTGDNLNKNVNRFKTEE